MRLFNISNVFPSWFLYSVDGKKYFECQPKYGSMVPIAAIEVGDFPREADDLDDEEI